MKTRKCKGRCKRKLSINNFLELSPITDLRYNICIDCQIEENNIQLTNLFNTSNQMGTKAKASRNFNQANDLVKLESFLTSYPIDKKDTNRQIAKELGTNINTLNSWIQKEVKLPNGLTVGEALDKIRENRNQKSENMENSNPATTATEKQVTTSTLKVAEMKAMLDNLVVRLQEKNGRLKEQLEQIVKEENEIAEMQKEIDILKDYFDNLKEVSHYVFDDFLIENDIELDATAKMFAEQLVKEKTPVNDLQFVSVNKTTTKYKYPIEILKSVLAPYLQKEVA